MPHHRFVPAVLVLCLLAVPAVLGEAPSQVQVAAAAAAAAESPFLPAALTALFDSVAAEPRVTMYPDGSGSVPAAMVEVVVAKVGPDGKVITGCVNDAEAARRFFAEPAARQPKQRTITTNESREQ